MELYQFLLTIFYLYYFSVKSYFFLLFGIFMSNHLHKKYIKNYEIQGKNKTLVHVCNLPLKLYKNILSYDYDNNFFIFTFMIYDKGNYYYEIIVDEITFMFSDLIFDKFNELLSKSEINKNNNKEINMDIFNTFFRKMMNDIPIKKKEENRNNSLLQKIKLENDLRFREIDDYNTDDLNDLNNKLLFMKESLEKTLDNVIH